MTIKIAVTIDRVSPITPLECGDENSRHPANDDPDIWNHREDHYHCADDCRKVQAEQCQNGANENAVNQTDKKLTTEVRDDVRVNL